MYNKKKSPILFLAAGTDMTHMETAYRSLFRLIYYLPWSVALLLPAVVLLLSRAVNALFRRHHTVTYHAILGAVIAMLIPIIPLEFVSVSDSIFDFICVAAGFAVSLVINHISQKYLKKLEVEYA